MNRLFNDKKLQNAVIAKRIADKRIAPNRYMALISRFEKRISYYENVLGELNSAVLVVGEDGVSGEIWLIEAARRIGVPVVIVPYEASGKEDFINLIHQQKRENRFNELKSTDLQLLEDVGCRNWAIESPFGWTSVYPVEHIVALKDCNVELPNPWTTHGGAADLLCVESQGMEEHYIDEGLPRSKLKLTGSPYGDHVYRAMQASADLARAYDRAEMISSSVTKVLVSLPASYHDTLGDMCPYPTYQAMCTDVASILGRHKKVEVTFVIHPAYLQQSKHLPSTGQFSLSTDWVMDLIPRHDIFISCGSSTLRWSVAARKPTINIDFYKFRLKFFDKLEGLHSFEEPAEFANFVDLLVTDSDAYRKIAGLQRSVGDKWGKLDGQNVPRIEELLASVASG